MMGHDTPAFRQLVRELVEKHTGPIDDSAIRNSLSRNGRFVSVTITVSAKSQEQLDDIYRDVSAHEDVLMAL
jgi:putative lipoic acid-binding regulatory protein